MEGKGKAKDQATVRTGSWLSKLRLGGSSNIKKGHLGEENQMYYNQELKRWVERGKEDEARAEMAPAAPPIVPIASITPRDGPLSSSMSKTKLARYVPTPGLSNSSSNNALGTTSFVMPPAASGPSGFGTLSAPGSFAAGMPPVTKFFIPGGGEQQPEKPVNMYAQQPKVLPPASEGDSADSASVGSSDEGKEQASSAALTQAAAATQTTAAANSYQTNGNGLAARASGGCANGSTHSMDGQPSSAHAWSAAANTSAAMANGFVEEAHGLRAAANMRTIPGHGPAGTANGPVAAPSHVTDLGLALHPGVAGKLDGPLPWELPDHLKHSDQFISICANWHINNPGVIYTPDLLLPNPAPAVAPWAPGAPRSAPAALAPIPLEPASMYGAPHTTATIEHTPAHMPTSDPPAMSVPEYLHAQQQPSVLEDPEGAQGVEQQGSAGQAFGTLGSMFEPACSQELYAPGWEVVRPAESIELAGVPVQQTEPAGERPAMSDLIQPQQPATHELQSHLPANGHSIGEYGASALHTAARYKAADSSEPRPAAADDEAARVQGSMPVLAENSTGVLPQVLDHPSDAQAITGQELGGEQSEATVVDPSGEGLQQAPADGQWQAPQTQEDLQQAAIAYAQYWAQVSCEQYGQEHWDYYYALCYEQYMQSVQQPSQQPHEAGDIGMVIVLGDSGTDPEASAGATAAVPEQQPAEEVDAGAPDAAAGASEFTPLISLGGGIADAPTSYPSSGQTAALAEELVSAALGKAMAELQADTMLDHIVGLAVDEAAAQLDSQPLAAEPCQREGSDQQGSAKKQRTEVGESLFELVIQSSELPAMTRGLQTEHEPQPVLLSPSEHEPQPVLPSPSEQQHEPDMPETLASGELASPPSQAPTACADSMAGFSHSAGMLEQLLAAVRQGQQVPQAVLHGPQGLLQLLGDLTGICREMAGEPANPEPRPPTAQSQGAAIEAASSNDESSTILQGVASATEPGETGAVDGPVATSAFVQQQLSQAEAKPDQAVMSMATHEALLSQRMEELRAAHDSQVQELQATFQRAHAESQAAFETRLEEEKEKITQHYQQRMDEMAAQLAEVQQQYESSQADNDGLFECLGLEEEKVLALSTIMREAGLDPDPTLQALEQQFEDKLAAQEAGDSQEAGDGDEV